MAKSEGTVGIYCHFSYASVLRCLYARLHRAVKHCVTLCNVGWAVNTKLRANFRPFLGAFAKLRKATISSVTSVCLSVCLSVRVERLRPHWTDLHEILCLSIFRKSAHNVQVSFKSVKNNGHFT
jgi:hypothetical protein